MAWPRNSSFRSEVALQGAAFRRRAPEPRSRRRAAATRQRRRGAAAASAWNPPALGAACAGPPQGVRPGRGRGILRAPPLGNSAGWPLLAGPQQGGGPALGDRGQSARAGVRQPGSRRCKEGVAPLVRPARGLRAFSRFHFLRKKN